MNNIIIKTVKTFINEPKMDKKFRRIQSIDNDTLFNRVLNHRILLFVDNIVSKTSSPQTLTESTTKKYFDVNSTTDPDKSAFPM